MSARGPQVEAEHRSVDFYGEVRRKSNFYAQMPLFGFLSHHQFFIIKKAAKALSWPYHGSFSPGGVKKVSQDYRRINYRRINVLSGHQRFNGF